MAFHGAWHRNALGEVLILSHRGSQVAMKLHQVQYWFFTLNVNGQILKKYKGNTNTRDIMEDWNKRCKKHRYDLCAHTVHSEEDGGAHGIHNDNREGKTTVKGHSFARIRKFIKGNKHNNGIVQFRSA